MTGSGCSGSCAARMEALERELRQLRASIDDMPRRVGLVLLEIGSALAADARQVGSSETTMQFPASVPRAAPEVAAPLTTEIALPDAMACSAKEREFFPEDEVTASLGTTPRDEAVATHSINVPQEKPPAAPETTEERNQAVPAPTLVADRPIASTPTASVTGPAGPFDPASNVIVLAPEAERRIIQRASWAALFALLAVLTVLGSIDKSLINAGQVTTQASSGSDPDWRTRPVREEISRLLAWLGF